MKCVYVRMIQRRMKRGDGISGKKKMITTVCKNSKEEEGKNESMIREKYWTDYLIIEG